MANLLFFLLPLLAIGQLAISVTLVNRWHSLGFPRKLLKCGDAVCYVVTATLPIMAVMHLLRTRAADGAPSLTTGWTIYWIACLASIVLFVATRVYHNTSIKTTKRLLSNHTSVVNLLDKLDKRPIGQSFTRFCSHLPLNEILQISVHEKTLQLPRMDAALDGLRITHISDLHMTGQLTKPFYDEVVSMVNSQPSDLVAITGDIVENRACLDWIADTLGKIEAKHGVFFVLGNHEQKIRDQLLVRSTLTEAGLINLGAQWQSITHNGVPIVLGGNELPWFRPPVDFDTSPARIDGHRPFRILLTHSPDQLSWARERDCDLMLAGHTHGGQVRLPGIGAILSPSRMGTRFACGTYYYEPTLMHVSRGLAGTRPLRLNCRPEIARLQLTSEAS